MGGAAARGEGEGGEAAGGAAGGRPGRGGRGAHVASLGDAALPCEIAQLVALGFVERREALVR